MSPREVSLSSGHNALTDLRRVKNDPRHVSSVRRSQNLSAPVERSGLTSGSMATRFTKSAERKANFPPESNSYLPQSHDFHPSSSNIPLTGDQETDANIMAFLKARDTIMQEQRGM